MITKHLRYVGLLVFLVTMVGLAGVGFAAEGRWLAPVLMPAFNSILFEAREGLPDWEATPKSTGLKGELGSIRPITFGIGKEVGLTLGATSNKYKESEGKPVSNLLFTEGSHQSFEGVISYTPFGGLTLYGGGAYGKLDFGFLDNDRTARYAYTLPASVIGVEGKLALKALEFYVYTEMRQGINPEVTVTETMEGEQTPYQIDTRPVAMRARRIGFGARLALTRNWCLQAGVVKESLNLKVSEAADQYQFDMIGAQTRTTAFDFGLAVSF